MKAIVVYDSVYENTAIIARAIGGALLADVRRVGEADPLALGDVEVLVVGSPTHGGRPTPAIEAYLKAIPAGALTHARVAAFDTRVPANERAIPLRILMRIIGYAAPRIARALQSKGGELVAGPEGFLVDGREGPLRAGERERAAAWGAGLGAPADRP
jgi:hypothetical protein